jgi:hypothetical protein
MCQVWAASHRGCPRWIPRYRIWYLMGRFNSGRGFSPRTSVFPYHHYFTDAVYPFLIFLLPSLHKLSNFECHWRKHFPFFPYGKEHSCWWVNSVKVVDPETSYGSGCKVVGWIKLVQYKVQWWVFCECDITPTAFAKPESILATWQYKKSVPQGTTHIFKKYSSQCIWV